MTAAPAITIRDAPGALPDMPLSPEQVTAGRPVARGAVLTQTADRAVISGYWSCDVGEFDWEFTWDEFVHLLQGEAVISAPGAPAMTLRAGQTAHFPLGLRTHWRIVQPVRKFFVARLPQPSGVS